MILPAPVSVGFAALRAHWKALAGGVVLAAFIILLLLYKAEKRHSAKVEERLAGEVKGRAQDRASYQNAQAAAAAMNKAQVATIEAKQEEITNDVSQDYAGDLARLRVELGRVRSKRSAAAVSPARSAQASGIPKPPARAGEASGLCLSPDLVLHGAETELQLDALITWIEGQRAVER